MANCSDYISADDLKTGKQAVQHIEHVAKSKDANGAHALTVTDTIRGEQVTNLTLDGMETQFQTAQDERETEFEASQADKEARFQQFLLNSGYQLLGDYENGPYTITARNQIIRYQNEFWRLNAATNPPYSTTGINSTSWATDVTHLVSVGDANLRQELASTGAGFGAELVAGARKVFRVTDYPNGAPDSVVVRASDGSLSFTLGTDNTAAFKAAITAAQAVNGMVWAPEPQNGKAYLVSEELALAVTSGNLWRGASFFGGGIYSTKIIVNHSGRAVSIKGTSGFPTNIKTGGYSLYPVNEFAGEAIYQNGITEPVVGDIGIYRFGVAFSFSNASAAGIFTEFSRNNILWLEHNAVAIKFRTDGGESSFHGVTFDNCIINMLAGQTGLDIGVGCNLYNANLGITFFGPATATAILNNGSRSGNDILYFEGDAAVKNNGNWSTTGQWRVQNNTGVIPDTSTIPFMCDRYVSPTNPLDANFSAVGFNKIQAMQAMIHNQAYRGLLRITGANAEGLMYVGNDSGVFESQGFMIGSQSTGDSIKDITPRQFLHLNGITSFRPEYRFNYVGGPNQLIINSNGRHTGVMGRRSAGSITGSGSPQTLSIPSLFAQGNQGYLISLSVQTPGATSKLLGTFCGTYNTTANSTCSAIGNFHSAGSELVFAPSSGVVIDSSGNLKITLTASIDASYSVNVVGIGTY